MTSMEIDNNLHHNDYLCKENYYLSFIEKEYEVANILLDLSNSSPPNLHYKSLSSSYPPTNNFPIWISKKKRSLPYSQPPPLPRVKKLLPEVTSPSSPHSFPPSEEPPHPCHSNPINIPFKLKSKKLKSIYLEAMNTQQTLKKGIEGVKNHRNGLKAENNELKAELEAWRNGGIQESEKVESQVQETSTTNRVTVKDAGASTSTQVYNPPPPHGKIQDGHNKQEKCTRGFDLNVPFVEENQEMEEKVKENIPFIEEKKEKVEERTSTQVTKLNRQRRMFILKNKKNMQNQ